MEICKPSYYHLLYTWIRQLPDIAELKGQRPPLIGTPCCRRNGIFCLLTLNPPRWKPGGEAGTAKGKRWKVLNPLQKWGLPPPSWLSENALNMAMWVGMGPWRRSYWLEVASIVTKKPPPPLHSKPMDFLSLF